MRSSNHATERAGSIFISTPRAAKVVSRVTPPHAAARRGVGMDLKTEYRFEADPDAVFAMFSDPEYQRQKLVDAGHTHVEVVECGLADDGTTFRIVTRRTVAVDVPGVL